MGVIDASSADSRVQKSAQVVLVLGAIAAILALLYAIWHRRSALTDPAGLHDALVYYALPLSILAVVLLLMAFWPRLDRLLMLLMVGAAFFALLMGEIYIGYQLTDGEGRARTAAEQLGFSFDARSENEVLKDLRASGVIAAPFVRINYDPKLVTLGLSPSTTVVVCNEFGPWFTPKTDRYGFVNSDAIWDTDARLDAVIVGDSFAMGQCDPTTGGVAELLRKQGNQILNLGIGGNDPLLDLASLVEFGSLKKSRLVFWLHYAGNDLSGLATNSQIPILRHYVDDPSYRQHLADRMPEIKARLAWAETFLLSPPATFATIYSDPKWILRTLRLYNVRAALGLARNIDEGVDFGLFQRAIERGRETAAGMGAHLVVVNIPAAKQVPYEGILDRKTEQAVKDAGVTYFDLRPLFEKTKDYKALYSQRYTGHFSPDGNRYVAQLLSKMLSDSR